MAEQVAERTVFGSFDKLGELLQLQETLLTLNPVPGVDLELNYQRFATTLDLYQEQPYLLDPYLEQLIHPVVGFWKNYTKSAIADPNLNVDGWSANRVARVLYCYVKFRGYKTIIRYFPHEIDDLSIVLEFMKIPNGSYQIKWKWATRYVMLLWLYIICIIPFDLAQFDDAERIGHTSSTILSIAKEALGSSGKEREAAALLLSRLYMRKDAGSGFHDFIEWAQSFLQNNTDDFFTALGLMQVLCEVVKSGSSSQVETELEPLLSIPSIIQQLTIYSNNTIIRKFRTKLVSRIGLRLLPGRNVKTQARSLNPALSTGQSGEPQYYDIEVPPSLEEILEQTFEALQDKDTVVRWSAAKGVARIAERLPNDFCSQILDTVTGLFEIHFIAGSTLSDLPSISEGTWHGACLACAEMARRSLIEPRQLPQLIEWLSKALYFDLRKGAHSIGSNVRDAAAYALWALARTQNQSALVPHASNLSQRLIAVALYDREIHIRRAASAAYQEHVGRTGLFPHGIDVLGKTDFYAVSIRKQAFLVAATQVAEHTEYRDFLFNHLIDAVLKHWDLPIRVLGSQSLRSICQLDLDVLGPQAVDKSATLLKSVDTNDIHGGLLGLSEIAIAYKNTVKDPAELESKLRIIFKQLNHVLEATLTTTRNELISAAACRLISNSITVAEIILGEKSSVPNWKRIIGHGLKHKMTSVQEEAANAMSALSNLTDCSADLIADLRRAPSAIQQSLSKVLSVINYNSHPKVLPEAFEYLLETVRPNSKANIETRRGCYNAIPQILSMISPNLASHVSSDIANSLIDSLLFGLDDYTIDERGDVGSWARVSCLQGLCSISELFFNIAGSLPNFESYFPPQTYISIASKVLKQGVERLDNVRQAAGVGFMKLINTPLPLVDGADRWRLPASALLHELFPSSSSWNDGDWLFPHVVRLLEVQEYRQQVLAGLVLSIGSKTDSTQKPVASSLVKFAQTLPLIPSSTSVYSRVELANDLIDYAKANMTSNSIVVPVFQTFTFLLEADTLRHLPDEPKGMQSMKTLLQMVSRNAERLKSVQRIHECMKITMNLLTFSHFRTTNADLLGKFLAHPFPKMRFETAEYLYIVLQSVDLGFDTEAIEDLLLETEWSSEDLSIVKGTVKELALLFASPKA